jgi:rhamnulokinase
MFRTSFVAVTARLGAEVTATGNIVVQALGAGEIAGLPGVREVVRRSFSPTSFEPRPDAA